MRSLSLSFVVMLVLAAVAVHSSDQTYSSGDVSVDVLGNSGSINVRLTSDSTNFIRIKQSKLEEQDTSGNAVNGRSINLASSISNAAWAPPVVVHQTDGIVYASTKFTSYMTVQSGSSSGGGSGSTTVATFELLARVYSNATTVQNGNEMVTVYKNSVKFSINVTGWPTFAATTNTLNYEIEVASKGGDNGGSMGSGHGNDKRVAFQNGLMDTPVTATVDGVANTPVTVTIVSKNNKQYAAFAFPAFQRSLQYDPVICVGSCDSAAAHAVASLFLVAAAVFASSAGRSFVM